MCLLVYCIGRQLKRGNINPNLFCLVFMKFFLRINSLSGFQINIEINPIDRHEITEQRKDNILHVVYFDKHLGAAHPKCGLK